MSIFLFTDIEGSTTKWEKHREEMGKALSRHDALLQGCMQAFGGRVIKHTGDGVFAVFEQGDPLLCALEVQKRLAREAWGEIGELRVRMALHAGEAEKRGGDYFGPVVNRTARLLSSGWGGQVLLSSEAASFCPLPSQATLKDLGTHLLKDLIEPQRIFMLTHPELPLKEFPPLRSLTACPNNLPPQPTPFLGREEELAEIQKLLERPSCRLLTLVGPGGIGKTRLALQAAADIIEAFPHGVYLVPLAPLSPEDFLVTTIGEFLLTSALAEALGFTFYGKEDPKAQLLNYLREKELLLLFDGFEHLLPGTALITDILNGAPKVKALATSRERLSLQGEWTVTITGLKVPKDPLGLDYEDYSAVRLFVETARRTDSGFRVRSEERECIGRICRLVEGLPLGIELAAAWVRVLSCREIVREIEKNRDFLESTLRDAPERHRSLRAVFESSWEHLKVEEKYAYQRLSVFRGGFTREAAGVVARTTLPLLSALLDKSLLRKGPTGRYEILEVLRQYAEEKYRESSIDLQETRSRHADFFGRYLQRREEALQGPEQRAALEDIAQEIENIREAWRWAVANQEKDSVARPLKTLFRYHMVTGRFREAEEAYASAAIVFTSQVPGDPGQSRLVGLLFTSQAVFAFRLGKNESSQEVFQKGLELLRKSGTPEDMAFCLSHYGILLHALGKFEEARAAQQEALDHARRVEDLGGIALALNGLGNVASVLGEHPEAKRLYRESLDIRRRQKDLRGIASCLNNLGVVAQDLGEYEESQRLYQESVTFYREIGDRWGTALALSNLGDITQTLGDLENARKLFQESLAIRKDIGDRRGVAMTLDSLGYVTLLLGNPAEAKTLVSESLAIRQELNDPRGTAYAFYHLGLVARALGDRDAARAHFSVALRTVMDIKVVPLILEILVGIASLWAEEEIGGAPPDRKAVLILELLAFCFAHPACDRLSRKSAENLFSKTAPHLNPDTVAEIQKRAKTKPLELVVEEALTACGHSG